MCDLRTCSRKKFVPKSVWFTVQVITSWYTIVKNSIVRWVISHIHQSARGQLTTIDSLQQERGKDNSVQPQFQSVPRRSQESHADSRKGVNVTFGQQEWKPAKTADFMPRGTNIKSNPSTKARTSQIRPIRTEFRWLVTVHAQLDKWQHLSRKLPKREVDQRKKPLKTTMHS